MFTIKQFDYFVLEKFTLTPLIFFFSFCFIVLFIFKLQSQEAITSELVIKDVNNLHEVISSHFSIMNLAKRKLQSQGSGSGIIINEGKNCR